MLVIGPGNTYNPHETDCPDVSDIQRVQHTVLFLQTANNAIIVAKMCQIPPVVQK